MRADIEDHCLGHHSGDQRPQRAMVLFASLLP